MRRRFLSLVTTTLTFLLLLFINVVTARRHLYTDSFPPIDEYDYSILDTTNVYGSPYGGFSRATRSRLASLPLHLPLVSDETPSIDDDPMYMEIRDSEGRLFACRVYHEDELDPSSLHDSMFDAPRFPITNEQQQEPTSSSDSDDISTVLEDEDTATGTPSGEVVSVPTEQMLVEAIKDAVSTTVLNLGNADLESATVVSNALLSQFSSVQSAVSPKADSMLLVQLRLSELMGVCGQIHKGWWSYDWCFERFVSQFHVELDPSSTSKVRIADSLSLGEFHRRVVTLDFTDAEPNPHAEDTPELARVLDIHTNGDVCDANDKPRTSYVHMMCCSQRVMGRRKGLLHREGQPMEPGLASVFDIKEDPNALCTYNLTVCTPLLCGDGTDDDDTAVDSTKGGDQSGKSSSTSSTNPSTAAATAVPKENESVLEILDRMLNGLCLQTSTGGWWTYEFCHGKKIRQYHEVYGLQKSASTGMSLSTKVVESEHILGTFDAKIASAITIENQHEYVVNATDTRMGGNGAYFEIEYPGGDVCDDSDVTERAIIAGNAGGVNADGSNKIARSSSVRYYCGDSFGIAVSEDATCHYIIEVVIPGICKHPLFLAPVRKSQVFKCLPV